MGSELVERPTLAKRALVVGINTYGADREPLSKAAGDAQDIARLLRDDFGFQVTSVLDHDATKQAIETAVQDHLSAADESTQWLFFFAGHGAFDAEGRGQLIAAPSSGGDAAIQVDGLVQSCLRGQPSQTLLLLDTCYSGRALASDGLVDDRLPRDPGRENRIHQVLAAAGTSQEVLEPCRGRNSVFTSCLIDALSGWYAVHEPDGSVPFDSLRRFTLDEAKLRGRQRGVGEQRIVGGNLVGTMLQLGIVLQPTAPRVSAAVLQGLASDSEEGRVLALSALLDECRRNLPALPLALALVRRHLRRPALGVAAPGGPPALTTALGSAERRAAAVALGELARLAQLASPPPPRPRAIDNALVRELKACVLAETAPEVRRAARRGLRCLADRPAVRLARALAATRRRSDRRLRRRAWEALVGFGAGRSAVPLSQRWRIPLTRGRLELAYGARLLWKSRTGRAAVLLLAALLFSFYLAGVSTYHIDLAEAALLVRSGLPAVRGAPGLGLRLVDTGFYAADLRPAQDQAMPRFLVGTWLWRQAGAQLWGWQVTARLEPSQAALALWRLGDSSSALGRMREGLAAGDPHAVSLAGYIALQARDPAPWLQLLVPLLGGPEAQQAPARGALRAALRVHPAAAAAALDGDLSRLEEPVLLPNPALSRDQIAQLAQRLESETGAARSDVLGELAAARLELLPQARLAAALESLLAEEVDLSTRQQAVQLLGGLHDAAAAFTAARALVSASHDRSPIVRCAAVRQLLRRVHEERMQLNALEPTLATALEDFDPAVQLEAAVGVATLADRLPALLPQASDRLLAELLAGESLLAQQFARLLPGELRRISAAGCRRLCEQLAPGIAAISDPQSVLLSYPLAAIVSEVPQCAPGLAHLAARLTTLEQEGDPPSLRGSELLWRLSELSSSWRGGALAEQVELLRAKSAAERAAACTAVGYLAPEEPAAALDALEALLALRADPDPRVRAAMAGALWTLSERQSLLVPRTAPLLAATLDDTDPRVRAVAARALERLPPDETAGAEVFGHLLQALDDTSPRVRGAVAASLGSWGALRSTGGRLTREALELHLRAETDVQVELRLSGALGRLFGGFPDVQWRVLESAARGLGGDEDQQELAVEVLDLLGQAHPEAAERVLERLELVLRRGPDGLSTRAIVAIAQIGMSHARGGALALRFIEPLLLDPAWNTSLRTLALLNIPRPVCREHPELAGRAARLLQKVLAAHAGRPHGDLDLVQRVLIEVSTLHVLNEPDALWPLLSSPRAAARAAGLEVLAALGDQRPDLVPSIRARLGELRRGSQPHVRLAAAQGEEAVSILEWTRDAVLDAQASSSWKETLKTLPSVGVEPAVRRALDRLEPGVNHG